MILNRLPESEYQEIQVLNYIILAQYAPERAGIDLCTHIVKTVL